MRDEVKRISQMVAEGKLSAEDAADLIDAFYASERTEPNAETQTPPPPEDGPTPPPPPPHSKDPFKSIVDSIEKLTKESIESVNWQEVSRQAREGAKKGFGHLKVGLEELSKGKIFVGFGANREVKQVSLPLSVPAGKVLRIENTAGDLKVVGGFDAGNVTANATVRAATTEEAKAKAESYTLVIEENDHAVVIKQPEIAGLSVDLEIQLAGNPIVEVKTESGDLAILDTKAGVRVHSTSGDVSLRGLEGSIEVNVTNGDLHLTDATASSMHLEATSGDIHVERVVGSLNVRTASGDLNLSQVSGKVISAESVSGDVRVELAEPVNGSLNVRTMSGDAHVSLPDGSDARVSVSTLRGDASCGVSLLNEARAEQRITGQLGDGSGTIDISAVSGDVRLDLRDQTQA